ncbi:23S rRNA (pseudouridine(1915)-N(3))-methyltransferase RlmH [Bacteriovoracaceae bacterium]|nr:23S rRNA (pseudouridine(1915)-N(3))-methyltransferase RlmH [Bacteriovoracaceae bacterium]
MLPQIKIITVGKLKDSSIKSRENNYLKRFNRDLEFIELKKSGRNIEEENNLILEKITTFNSNWRKVFLTEKGKLLDSIQFADNINSKSHLNHLFIIGGSYGFNKKTLETADLLLSLSPLTFPHQVARLILVEQLYRSQTIINKHPYHH